MRRGIHERYTLHASTLCATAPFDQDDKSIVGAKTFTVKTFDPAHGAEWTVVDLATFETEKVMAMLTATGATAGAAKTRFHKREPVRSILPLIVCIAVAKNLSCLIQLGEI